MKKVTVLTATSVLTLCVGYGSAFSSDLRKSPGRRSVPRKSMSFLLTIASKKGKIKHVKDNIYLLDIKLNHINQVSQLPTATNEQAHIITDNSLEKVWGLGDNNFSKHPARAVLSAQDLAQTSVIITHMHVDNNDIVYQFKSTKALHAGDYLNLNLVINKHADSMITDYSTSRISTCSAGAPTINGKQPSFVVAHYEFV